MLEKPTGETHLPMSGEFTKTPTHIPLTSSHQPAEIYKRSQPMQQNVPAPQHVPQTQLNPYQKLLLEELKKSPNVMKLMSVIFQQYPSVIVTEFRQTNPNATNRQQNAGRETQRMRLQIEAFIEEEIAKLAGIDVEKLLDKAKKEVSKQKKS